MLSRAPEAQTTANLPGAFDLLLNRIRTPKIWLKVSVWVS
jgi:hypothetical protein